MTLKFDPKGDTSTLGDSLVFSATILKEKVSISDIPIKIGTHISSEESDDKNYSSYTSTI